MRGFGSHRRQMDKPEIAAACQQRMEVTPEHTFGAAFGVPGSPCGRATAVEQGWYLARRAVTSPTYMCYFSTARSTSTNVKDSYTIH